MEKKRWALLLFFIIAIPLVAILDYTPAVVEAQPSGTILSVDGYDDQDFTYDELLSLPNVTLTGWMGSPDTLNGSWKGVTLQTLGSLVEGSYWSSYNMTVFAPDGFQRKFNWTLVQNQGCMIAYSVNGSPLDPAVHGYIRMIWLNGTSSYWIKNASRIVLSPITGDARLDYTVNVTNIGVTTVFSGLNLTSYPNITSDGGLITSFGSTQGPWRLRGINLTALLLLTGPWNSTSALRVTARDGYITFLDWNTVMNNGSHTMILAYEIEGDLYPLSGSPQGPRIIVVGSEGPITDGHNCPWGVAKLEVLHKHWQSFSFELYGVSNYTVDHSYFYAGMSCPETTHAGSIIYNGHNWTGIPLWLFVGFVDAINPHDDYNDTSSHSATVRTHEGTVLTIPRNVFDRDDSLILAPMLDGAVIFEPYPVSLVGKGFEVEKVSSITVNLDQPPTVDLYNVTDVSGISASTPLSIPFLYYNTLLNISSLNTPTMLEITTPIVTDTIGLEGVTLVSPYMSLSSSETVTTSMTVRVYYTDSQLLSAGVVNELSLKAYTYHDGIWQEKATTISTEENYIEFTTTDFESYFVGSGGGGDPLLPLLLLVGGGIAGVVVVAVVIYFVKFKPKT
ncbi:MAG: hypothetical protein ACW976_03420 [Candidatus Ranarchaeia archaeon]|jgi:hypothetical protein